jgi:hypothetical protein
MLLQCCATAAAAPFKLAGAATRLGTAARLPLAIRIGQGDSARDMLTDRQGWQDRGALKNGGAAMGRWISNDPGMVMGNHHDRISNDSSNHSGHAWSSSRLVTWLVT